MPLTRPPFLLLAVLPVLPLLATGCLVENELSGWAWVTGSTRTPEADGDSHWWSTNHCWPDYRTPDGVNIDEACVKEKVDGVLEPMVEWSMVSFGAILPEYNATLMMPAVGNLTDDNGDGVIGLGDIPDIVVVNDRTEGEGDSGVFRIISGDGGSVPVSILDVALESGLTFVFDRYSNVALGDIDLDGVPEIVVLVSSRGTPGVDTGSSSGSGVDTMPPETGLPVDTGGSSGSSSGPVGPRPWNPVPPPSRVPAGDVPGGQCALAAFTPAGDLEWVATDVTFACQGHSPALADLEGDGDVEVILGSTIVEGADGSLQASPIGRGRGSYQAIEQVGYQSFPIDLDRDGVQEVVAGATLYEPDGQIRCDIDPTFDDGFPAAADLNGDGFGEFVVVGNGWMRLFNAQCAYLGGWKLVGEGCGGPPTIADFDGDEQPEIGTVNAEYYQVYEVDGTLLWTRPVSDWSSHTTGSSVFDFDGDGRMEVLYGDETTLWVFDGATGEPRLAWTEHTSRTLHEYPVVVDVDADGLAEMVVPNGGGHYSYVMGGLNIIGSARSNWRSVRQVWNQHAYNIVNINDDLSIPTWPASNWPQYNNFRAGNTESSTGARSPDAVPTEADICVNKCRDGLLGVRLALGNGGTANLAAGIPASIYAEVDGEREYLVTAWSSAPLVAGGVVDLFFQVPEDRIPEGVVVIVVDDQGGAGIVGECHEDNNEIRITGVTCLGS